MSTNPWDIFAQLDEDHIPPRPVDLQEQDYRLLIDFEHLAQARDLVLDMRCDTATDVVYGDGTAHLLAGVLELLDDIVDQRIPNPGGPQ